MPLPSSNDRIRAGLNAMADRRAQMPIETRIYLATPDPKEYEWRPRWGWIAGASIAAWLLIGGVFEGLKYVLWLALK